jgi:hypothetical protein
MARQMDDWQLLPRPERVTELYFTDYRQLALSTKHNRTQTVSFTVRNLEHQTTTYHYILSVAAADNMANERVVGSGSFALAHDGSLTTDKTITLPPLKGHIAVKVDLDYRGIAFGGNTSQNQKQSIHYWTSPTDPEGRRKTS